MALLSFSVHIMINKVGITSVFFSCLSAVTPFKLYYLHNLTTFQFAQCVTTWVRFQVSCTHTHVSDIVKNYG